MNLGFDFKNLEEKYEFSWDQRLNSQGKNSVAYKLDGGLFGKVQLPWSDHCIFNEAKIQLLAFKGGIQVSKPYGVFSALNRTHLERTPLFVMDYLEGIPLNLIKNPNERIFARQLYSIELDKARQLGFIPQDCIEENAIWNSEKEMVHPVDLASWLKPQFITL